MVRTINLRAVEKVSQATGSDRQLHTICIQCRKGRELITCQDDILSLSDDKSIDDSSPVKRRRSCADPVSPLSVNQPSQCNEQDDESTAAEEQQKANTLLLVSNNSPAMNSSEFVSLRITYLIVTLVIMLADGLQGKNHDW